MPPLAYPFAPDGVTHSWPEVYLPFDQAHDKDRRWIGREGVIMDRPHFLAARRLLMQSGREMGYAIGMPAAVLANCAGGRCIDWDGVHDVTCQMTAVVSDHGTAADPEKYYRQHALSGLPRLLFERHVSQEMTRRAAHVRHEGEL